MEGSTYYHNCSYFYHIASQQATENAGLKAKLEEEKARRTSYEDEISRLKVSL